MKRWLVALLALSLLLMSIPAPAETGDAALAALPETGGVVNGFELIESRDFAEINTTVYRFEHRRTGAELFYFANEDTNRLFDLTFHTQAIDNTGLPHVFEHATLSGSAKYPSEELWFNLLYGSYNTFMNAMTGQTYTTYPIASLSEAQLLKFADFYTDCCLNPMVMARENIFREEAWRYRMGGMDDDLTLEGTVYSEMLGAVTLESMSLYNSRRAAMPGSYYGNVSGGDPAHIPEMTYDALKDYHDRYYHPSNCVAFLYGQFDDYAAFLALLDEAFAPYERREFTFDDPGYTPITEPVEAEFAFPVEAGSDTVNASSVAYAVMCPGLSDDPDASLRLSLLAAILNSDSSQLSQAMRKALPTASFGCALLEDGPEDCFLFIANKVNPEDRDTFKRIIDDALAEIAENGFPQDMLDGLMASLEVASRLTMESSSIGIDVIPSFAAEYISTGVPFRYIDAQKALSQIDAWNREGVFAALAGEWLVGSRLTATTVTYPEPGLKERQAAALAEKLAEIKAAMSEDALNAIIEASNAPKAENPDTASMLEALTAATVESLPEEYRTYAISDETRADGTRAIEAVAGVDGIGRVTLFFDAQGIPQEDIHWFHLFVNLIGELDTAEHTREELDVLIDRYLYGLETRLSLAREGDGYHPRMRLGWIALDEDQADAYDLMREIVYDTQYDPAQVLENIRQYKSYQKSSITNNPYSALLIRSMATTLPVARYSMYYDGLDFYSFLADAERLFTDDPDAGVAKLEAMQRYFDNSANAITAFAGSEESIAANRPLAEAYLARLDSRPIEPVDYDLPVPAANEGLIVDSSVQYNLIAADYDALETQGYSADMNVMCALVNDSFLLPLLRDQYGAYSVMHGATEHDGIYICTYRDPNVTETFDVYDQLPELIEDIDLDQAALDRYILSEYAGYAMSRGELSGAMDAISNQIEGRSQDEVLEDMRALKAVTPDKVKGYAEMYRRLIERGNRSSAGGASAINANVGLYDVVLNPFGAVDNSRQALSDIDEGSDAYEAVRYAFENNLMAARDDGSFGADEPAAAGDIATALYAVSTGEQAPAEEAVAAMAEYGILWADAQPDEALTAEACADVLNAFAYAVGLDSTPDISIDGDPFTRAALAQALYDYIGWIESAQAEAA